MSPAHPIAAATADHEGASPEQRAQRLALGAQRVRAQAERAEHERRAALRLRGGLGVGRKPPAVAVEDIDHLVRASWDPSRSLTTHREHLEQIDASLWALRDSLVNNPLWVEATQREHALAPASGVHLQRAAATMEPELAPASDAVARCAGILLDAEEARREWESRPEWLRTVQDWLFDTGENVQQQVDEARAEVAAAQTALDEKYARVEAQAAEARAAEERADREQRERARLHREVLELPLREALLERAMLNDTFPGRDVQPLREAPPDEPLRMIGVGGDPVTAVILQSPTTTYVGDWTALGDQGKAVVGCSIDGDLFRYERREDGTRTLQLRELAPLLPDRHDFEGVVGATQHRNGQLVEFHLVDRHGSGRWVRPSEGGDLLTELRGDHAAIISGNQVRVENGKVELLARAPSLGVER